MERLTYDFALGGNHCWQVKGADNLECREVCERQGDNGCKTCPIAKAFDRLAAIEDILGDEYDLDELSKAIDAQPTADVVEVTFCKDCRYYQDAKVNEKGFLICPASGMEITETDFCSYGQRKIETVLPKSDAKDESLEGEHD